MGFIKRYFFSIVLLYSTFTTLFAQASTWHYSCKIWYENTDFDGDGVMDLNDFVIHYGSLTSASNPCSSGLCNEWWSTDPGFGAVSDVILYSCYQGEDEPPPPPVPTCPQPYMDPTGTPAVNCLTNYTLSTVALKSGPMSCCKLNECASCPAPCIAVSTGASFSYAVVTPVPIPILIPAVVGCMNPTTFEIGSCGSCPTSPPTCGDMSLNCIGATTHMGCY